ncbi:MAG: hypothetical protein QXP70_00410, partial [Methanomassiliicoccales archaeon]
EVVIGAKTRDELFFERRMTNAGANVHLCTDDGSVGHHGQVTDVVKRVISDGKCRRLVACGPERMLYAVAKIAHDAGISSQISVERHMKCGIGICDACSLDGRLVCLDGPIFDGEVLLKTEDFGRYRLAPDGRKVPI